MKFKLTLILPLLLLVPLSFVLSQPLPGPAGYIDRECVLNACIGTVPGIDQKDPLVFVDCILTPGQPMVLGCTEMPGKFCVEEAIPLAGTGYCQGVYLTPTTIPVLKNCYAGFLECLDPRDNLPSN